MQRRLYSHIILGTEYRIWRNWTDVMVSTNHDSYLRSRDLVKRCNWLLHHHFLGDLCALSSRMNTWIKEEDFFDWNKGNRRTENLYCYTCFLENVKLVLILFIFYREDLFLYASSTFIFICRSFWLSLQIRRHKRENQLNVC